MVVREMVGCNPSPGHIEIFCKAAITPAEKIIAAFYYDCPPFKESRALPISNAIYSFKSHPAYWKAFKFQEKMLKNGFFSYRIGKLSFDGWKLKDKSLKELIATPRALTDDDFDPILTQKQVDMMIGLDVAKLVTDRLILITADSDFIPAIQSARSKGTRVTLITGNHALLKKPLIKACDEHRDISSICVQSAA